MTQPSAPRTLLEVLRFRHLLCAAAWAATVGGLSEACSSNGNVRPTTTGGDTLTGNIGGSTATGGIAQGAGGAGIGPGSGGAGGAGGTIPPLIPCDPPTMPCPAPQICVKGPMGGVCSPPGGPCDPAHDMCPNDTYCCGPGCRIGDPQDPICVSGGTRPVNSACNTKAAIGAFAPDLQCQWKGPVAGEPLPLSSRVLVSPLVADLPNNSGTAAEIIVVSTEKPAGSDMADGQGAAGGVIRILNGQTCKLEETIDLMPRVRDTATPAIADLDNDGTMEIVARTDGFTTNGVVAFTWDAATGRYKVMWVAPMPGAPSSLKDHNWDGVSIHDIDDDGFPEIIGRGGSVWDHTGRLLSAGPSGILLDSEPAVGDLDGDGKIELAAASGTPTAAQGTIYRWNAGSWQVAYPGPSFGGPAPAFFGFADFDKDGKAEVVGTGNDIVVIYTLAGQVLLRVQLSAGEAGGPPTIGDFDGDKKPEVASAGATAFRVFDIDCAGGGAGCMAPGIRWSKPSQDATSRSTGSTIFDFEGDGIAEAVYADECFLRVYNGNTGDVLYSAYRNSCTWWEQPIVADPDNSTRTKIIVNGNTNCFVRCANPLTTDPGVGGAIDKEHPGVRCQTNADCYGNNCVTGFCRCNADTDCNNVCPGQMPAPAPLVDPNCVGQVNVGPIGGPFFKGGLVCANPIPGTPGTGKVCRMQHPDPDSDPYRTQLLNGVKVYRDKLDRWAASRNLWNQNVYSITNINDDGKVPKTSAWKQNFLDPTMNNFRANRQGATSNDLADITGALDAANACQLTKTGGVLFTGKICNRGLRGVASNMPATFYLGGGEAGALGAPICQTTTLEPVPVGGCKPVTCEIPKGQVPDGATITMIVNDAGGGTPGTNRITDECNYENNSATITVPMCTPPPK